MLKNTFNRYHPPRVYQEGIYRPTYLVVPKETEKLFQLRVQTSNIVQEASLVDDQTLIDRFVLKNIDFLEGQDSVLDQIESINEPLFDIYSIILRIYQIDERGDLVKVVRDLGIVNYLNRGSFTREQLISIKSKLIRDRSQKVSELYGRRMDLISELDIRQSSDL